jgi:hypothetical protein
MPYEPFHERFRELAFSETRSITVGDDSALPADEYAFLEAFCNDEDCDCRRVMFNVVSLKRQEVVAVIAYGWESRKFYIKWNHGKNIPEIIDDMIGPILNSASRQTKLAPALLVLVRNVLLKDLAYIERVKRHYWIFKAGIDPVHFKSPYPNELTSKKTKKRHRTWSK